MLAPTLVAGESAATATQGPTQTQTQGSIKLDGKFGWKGKPATSKMEACLRTAYAMMKRKVFSAPKDCVGIVIFNTASPSILLFACDWVRAVRWLGRAPAPGGGDLDATAFCLRRM